MKLDTQKRLAGQLLKCSPSKVLFDTEDLESISEAITKADLRKLIKDGVITKKPVKGVSRSRANKRLVQRRKGRQQGPGTKKGTKYAREPKKLAWMNKIRSQRKLLYELREKKEIDQEGFRELYAKAKGGFFRSRRHINLYIDEQKMRKVKHGKQ